MKNISVIGVGYVGLVTGVCLADLGNRVVCVDINEEKIERLNEGEMPIYEPGLEDLVERNVRAGRLTFTTSYAEGLEDAEFVFIAVGTPEGVDGEADLRYVRMAARSIADEMDHRMVIVNKATVPVGTGDWVADLIRQYRNDDIDFSVVSNPEFLREGSAISDFLGPDRVVLGSLDREAAERVAQLYLPLRTTIMITDLRTAEMIKYASNAFLATRISFINEIANICEALGADVKEVATGMGYDNRIGHGYLDAGVGYGGSCFPKDVKALTYMAEIKGRHPQLLRAVMDINDDQRRQVVRKLDSALGGLRDKTIGLLGLAFKPNTDDMREAPAAYIARMLESAGATVRGYDPVAKEVARRMLPKIELLDNAYDAAEGCDALVVVTEWNEFKNLDLGRIRDLMAGNIIIDGRNIYEPEQMADLGFFYRGIGRGYETA
ncbi:MAG: UDP-glucose/GDP-mannose dehydrogenase family protein [Anaerolineae bacterium]|jgi:UDPglucose 6-dehydrogenase